MNLLGEASTLSKVESLFYLTRDSFKRRQIETLWREKMATSPANLTTVLLSPGVVDEMRKELRRQTGYNAEASEIIEVLRTSVLRADLAGVSVSS